MGAGSEQPIAYSVHSKPWPQSASAVQGADWALAVEARRSAEVASSERGTVRTRKVAMGNSWQPGGWGGAA
jgi:hypothetical protein